MVNGADGGMIDKVTGVPSPSEHVYVCTINPADSSSLIVTMVDNGSMVGAMSLTF